MENRTIVKIVKQFRADLAARKSTFFLVYSDLDPQTREVALKVTSNSTPDGISAMLRLLLCLNEESVEAFQTTLLREPSAPSLERTRELLEAFCRTLTVRAVESPTVKSS